MGENSAIEWCDHTFNPWIGCTKVSPACDHCYAEGWAKRTGNASLWQGERRRTSEANWRQPIIWNRKAEAAGVRARVFCASLADVFDNQVPEEWRADLWDLIQHTEHLDWLLLTKRPQNIARMLPQPATGWQHPGWPWPNVWLETTVESQEQIGRLDRLLKVPGQVTRFLSCEPLLGPLRLADVWIKGDTPLLDWVIAGGESGPHARPMHPDWARSLRDQCADSGVPFFFKQWGNWTQTVAISGSTERADALYAMRGDGTLRPCPDRSLEVGEIAMVRRLTKAGAELDGRKHREVPNA